MNIAADKIPCKALDVTGAEIRIEQDKKNWVEYSQLIAGVMSKRMVELGFTQLMLAEKMNCTQQYISKILKGKKNMSLETICKIENALGIEIIKSQNRNE
jgi:ribosome-binding protein aMBF1 (putative translation factor)